MNKKIVLIASLMLMSLAACTESSSNSSNKPTAAAINATKQRIDNLKANANQRADAVDSLASPNSNKANSQ